MKHKKIKISILLLFFGLTVSAQQAALSAGGDAQGSGGTASYSYGQICYVTHFGTNGSVAQGVQQPYEISMISGINNQLINLSMQIYPNPTNDYLILNIDPFLSEGGNSLFYQLYDIKGRLIEIKKITHQIETIPMGNLETAIYFLKVSSNNKEIKTFKIIKN